MKVLGIPLNFILTISKCLRTRIYLQLFLPNNITGKSVVYHNTKMAIILLAKKYDKRKNDGFRCTFLLTDPLRTLQSCRKPWGDIFWFRDSLAPNAMDFGAFDRLADESDTHIVSNTLTSLLLLLLPVKKFKNERWALWRKFDNWSYCTVWWVRKLIWCVICRTFFFLDTDVGG